MLELFSTKKIHPYPRGGFSYLLPLLYSQYFSAKYASGNSSYDALIFERSDPSRESQKKYVIYVCLESFYQMTPV